MLITYIVVHCPRHSLYLSCLSHTSLYIVHHIYYIYHVYHINHCTLSVTFTILIMFITYICSLHHCTLSITFTMFIMFITYIIVHCPSHSRYLSCLSHTSLYIVRPIYDIYHVYQIRTKSFTTYMTHTSH